MAKKKVEITEGYYGFMVCDNIKNSCKSFNTIEEAEQEKRKLMKKYKK